MAVSLTSSAATATARVAEQEAREEAKAMEEDMDDHHTEQLSVHHATVGNTRMPVVNSRADNKHYDDDDEHNADHSMADDNVDGESSLSSSRSSGAAGRKVTGPKKRRRATVDGAEPRSQDAHTDRAGTVIERARVKRRKKRRDDGDDEYTLEPSSSTRHGVVRTATATRASLPSPATAAATLLTSQSALSGRKEGTGRPSAAVGAAAAAALLPSADTASSPHRKGRLAPTAAARDARPSSSAITPRPLREARSYRDSELPHPTSTDGGRAVGPPSQASYAVQPWPRQSTQQQRQTVAATEQQDADSVEARPPRPVGCCTALSRRLWSWMWSWVHAAARFALRLVALSVLLAVAALVVLSILQWRSDVSRQPWFCASPPTAAAVSSASCALDSSCPQQLTTATTPHKVEHCTPCPANGLCDGKGRLHCNDGFFRDGSQCIVDTPDSRHLAQLKQRALLQLHTRAGLYDCTQQAELTPRGMNATELLAAVGWAHQADQLQHAQPGDELSTLFDWLQADTTNVRVVSRAGLLNRIVGLVRTHSRHSPLYNTYESVRAKRAYWCQMRYTAAEQWWPLLCITLTLASPLIVWHLVRQCSCRTLGYIAVRVLFIYIARRALGSRSELLLRWLGVPDAVARSSSMQRSASPMYARLASLATSAVLHAPVALTFAWQLYRWLA